MAKNNRLALLFAPIAICLIASPAYATKCFLPSFMDPQKSAREREREVRQSAINSVQSAKIMFWGRPTQYQCLGDVGKGRARINDYAVSKWVKGGTGPTAQALKSKHPLDSPSWCSEGSGSFGDREVEFRVLYPLAAYSYESGYSKAVLDKLDGAEDWECTPDIMSAMNKPAWTQKDEPDAMKRHLWNLFRDTVHKEISKLK